MPRLQTNRFLFKPGSAEDGQRIDKALGAHADVGSRSRAEHLIEKGLVKLRGSVVKSSYRIQNGDEFEIELPAAEPTELVPSDLPLDIFYEDNDVLVVNKPAGLVVHPAAGHADNTLVNALIQRPGFHMKFGETRPGIVHRLDKDTSGLLVVAKNDSAQHKLVEQFKSRCIHRRYQAIVIARQLAKKGTIQSFLARHPTDRKKYASVRNEKHQIIRDPKNPPSLGKWAVTHYEVVQSKGDLHRLRIKLETGRTHQIRVHLSELGAPILADPIYGKPSKDIPRLCLHAEELGFLHPRTGEQLEFHSTWPPDLAVPLARLGIL